MPVVSAHHRTDHLTVHFSDEEQADVMIDFTFDVHFRVVPWTQQITTLPEGDHLFEIFTAKNAYFHGIGYLFRTLKAIMARTADLANI